MGLLSGIASLIGSVYSANKSAETSLEGAQISADTAKQINDDNIAYQKEYNQQIFDREDTTYQRAVADAEAAGLSPLVAAGVSAGESGGVTSAPQSDTSQASIMMQGYQGVAQAFQQLSSISAQADLVRSQARLNEANADKTDKEAGNIETENLIKFSELDLKERQRLDSLLMNQQNIASTEKIADLNREVQVLLKSMDVSWDRLKQMNEHDFQTLLEDKKFKNQLEALKADAGYKTAFAELESTLRQSDDAAAQNLAYTLKSKWYTDSFAELEKFINPTPPYIKYEHKVDPKTGRASGGRSSNPDYDPEKDKINPLQTLATGLFFFYKLFGGEK